MLIGVPLETVAGETRVAVTPETAKKLKAQGHTVRVQGGAGVAASAPDAAYEAVGAEITDRAGALGCSPQGDGESKSPPDCDRSRTRALLTRRPRRNRRGPEPEARPREATGNRLGRAATGNCNREATGSRRQPTRWPQ